MRRLPRLGWILAFLIVLTVVALLATSWNVVLVDQYEKLVELTAGFRNTGPEISLDPPWWKIALGSAGFLLALVGIVLFFFKSQIEMNKNQIQRDFLAKMSHELKSPLATLELTSSLLKKRLKSQDPETEKLWKAHDSELKRLSGEMELLLESSRWEVKKPKANFSKVNLEAWLQKQMPTWHLMLGPGSQLERSGQELPKSCILDEHLFRLVSNNIVSNARKFSIDSKAQVMVHTEQGEDGSWSIEFRDQGWGFGPEIKSEIFGRFVRGQHGAPYAISGTGLGLFLAKQACRVMKLKLQAESEGPGKGASFAILSPGRKEA